jgi:hypothetical protein
MRFLDFIGSFFVYKSPEPREGMRTHLRHFTSKQLQRFAGTPSHYSKTILINMILDEMDETTK